MAVISLEATTAPDAPVKRRPSRGRRIMGYLLYGLATLIIVIYLAGVLWKMSGSSRWELELKKNGVQVYSLKAPGSHIKQFKAVMRAQYTLNHGVRYNDIVGPNCIAWLLTVCAPESRP